MTPFEILLTLTAALFILGFGAFALTSAREGHRRAARLAILCAALSTGLLVVGLLFIPFPLQQWITVLLGGFFLILILLFFLPSGQSPDPSPRPNTRVDERTVMFARARLAPGSPEYKAYYQAHPEHLAADDAFRQNPGLLQPRAVFFDELLAASPIGSFFLTEQLRQAVDGPLAAAQIQRPPEQFTRYVKELCAYYGALAAGVCRLQPYQIYSHIGRGTGKYGAPVTLDHAYAIAFTVEMAHEMVTTAPKMAAVMESARQYVEAAKIAVAVAAAIRQLGYPARAHIDGNYRVIAPIVAKDAGLGEIGRMGILMTPRQGPRVRLGVVTTDLPLVPDEATWDPAVIDFCTICQKCAEVCPAQAIPFGDREVKADESLRWQINPERCYTYWTKIGTDCGRCMAVCPYAHADSPFHTLIRLGASRSGAFRRAILWLDDIFYGRKPTPHPAPKWVNNPPEKKKGLQRSRE